MKTSSPWIIFTALLLIASSRPAAAQPTDSFETTTAVAADALIGRPLCFAATIIGTGLFVATLPIALISRSVNKTANALVVTPAKLTFTRKLGDFEEME